MSTMTLIRYDRSVAFCAEVQDEAGARTIPLPRGRFDVGSAKRCAITIADPAVSAAHLVLEVNDRVLVRDARSKNGTYVGAVRVHHAVAEPGAIITLGRSSIALRAISTGEIDIDVEPLPGLAGASLVMRRVAAQARTLASLRSPVLICGESGTGKELVAHALHELSSRRSKPFVAINVTSVPRELVESEFFGHEKGSFTGAVARRRGAFEEAEGGTLFLDEIGDLPIEAQPKLLRALDGYGMRSVGASGTATRDVRVVAATHAALRERVREGAFRRDLFHRLEVFTIQLPPLRERRGDIGPIARRLLRSMETEVGPKDLSSAGLARLAAEPWPGNVRELRNVLLRAAALAPSDTIDAIDVHHALGDSGGEPVEAALAASSGVTPAVAKTMVREHRGNVSAAARAARVPRTSFRKLLSKPGAEE
ncbi:MAG TPA: sigma 54-interacting transcriptional regulator [Polyangiaceae bacterium]|jgi:DNA-binding NtrC family response regulator